MDVDFDLKFMQLGSLSRRCAQESDLFFRHQEHDPRFCYEIFRRAILNRDEKAWDCVYHQYETLVASWVERHSFYHILGEERDFFVNGAFAKMWAVLTPEKFPSFADLKSILKYLQLCVHSVLADALRLRRQADLFQVDLEGLEDREDAHPRVPEEQVFRRAMAEDLLALLYRKANNLQERRIAYGLFVLDLKPAEILEIYAGEFRNVQEVYRVKENFLARLKRDREFLEFIEDR
jgi:hypothetical protein